MCVAEKVYSDSAFYADPSHKYPTIEEQMKLAKLISTSLTSAANRRARGAKMFAKRRKRSSKWVHEGGFDWASSSAGDVANLDDLDSELGEDEGGSRQLFAFRIPSVKHRVVAVDKNTRMALKQDEFERLRLQAPKTDHRQVNPGKCFDIAADLKASRGKGGRMFEKRRSRADKFILDESNAKILEPKTRLDIMTGSYPLKSNKSPWEAAQGSRQGAVDSAFNHLNERDRVKSQLMQQYNPPNPAVPRLTKQVVNPPPAPQGPRTDLRTFGQAHLLQGRNFNRAARGWQAPTSDPLQPG